jgi:hypothetical protein
MNRPMFDTREDVPEEYRVYAYQFIAGTEEGPLDGDGQPTALTTWKWTYDTAPEQASISIIRVNEIVNKSGFLSLSPVIIGGDQKYVIHRANYKPLSKDTLAKIFVGDDMDAFTESEWFGGFEINWH